MVDPIKHLVESLEPVQFFLYAWPPCNTPYINSCQHDYGSIKQNPSLHWKLAHCNHASLFSMGEMIGGHHFIRGEEWSKFICISHKALNGEATLSHPWFFGIFQEIIEAHGLKYLIFAILPLKGCNQVSKNPTCPLSPRSTSRLYQWFIGICMPN